MPDWVQVALGCLAGVALLAGVFWLAVRPAKRGASSRLAPPSGLADEPGKYNEQTLLDP